METGFPMPQELQGMLARLAPGYEEKPMTVAQRLQEKCDAYNRSQGAPSQDGMDCPICRNKGFVAVVEEHGGNLYESYAKCECVRQRASIQRMKDSGLEGLIQRYTIDKWRPDTPIAEHMLMTASKFITNQHGAWFFVGGQSGSGKTHICTATCGELMKMGKTVKYMLWRDEVTRLKAQVGKDDQYSAHMEQLKKPDVLYIDDLFKTGRSADSRAFSPTAADINAAFEIINHRYNDPRKITIISTEILLPDMSIIDEALAGRIRERCGEFIINIGYDPKKNRRMA